MWLNVLKETNNFLSPIQDGRHSQEDLLKQKCLNIQFMDKLWGFSHIFCF